MLAEQRPTLRTLARDEAAPADRAMAILQYGVALVAILAAALLAIN